MMLFVYIIVLWTAYQLLKWTFRGIAWLFKKRRAPAPPFDVPLLRLWHLDRRHPEEGASFTSGVVCALTEDEARSMLNAAETNPMLKHTWDTRAVCPNPRYPGQPMVMVTVIGYPLKGALTGVGVVHTV